MQYKIAMAFFCVLCLEHCIFISFAVIWSWIRISNCQCLSDEGEDNKFPFYLKILPIRKLYEHNLKIEVGNAARKSSDSIIAPKFSRKQHAASCKHHTPLYHLESINYNFAICSTYMRSFLCSYSLFVVCIYVCVWFGFCHLSLYWLIERLFIGDVCIQSTICRNHRTKIGRHEIRYHKSNTHMYKSCKHPTSCVTCHLYLPISTFVIRMNNVLAAYSISSGMRIPYALISSNAWNYFIVY